MFENIKYNCHPVSGTFYYFNSIINPFLYSIMSKRFRRAFKELQAAFICKYFVVKSTSNSSSKENVECSGNKITKCKKQVKNNFSDGSNFVFKFRENEEKFKLKVRWKLPPDKENYMKSHTLTLENANKMSCSKFIPKEVKS